METRFVVTPWRDADELLELRRDLFGTGLDVRDRAVNKIAAWRARKLDLPLLLESTADLVDVGVRDDAGVLPPGALRMLYAAAVSRFITGLLDTQTELTRLRSSRFPSAKPPSLPPSLRETRHRIVHRHLPSLAELKRAQAQCLSCLWDSYWSLLDAALTEAPNGDADALAAHGDADAAPVPPDQRRLAERALREQVQALLKTYIKARKAEVKTRRRVDRAAAGSAVRGWIALAAPTAVKKRLILDILVTGAMVLPADKKLGSSMAGAYLMWTPFLRTLCRCVPSFLTSLLTCMLAYMAKPGSGEEDAAREGMHDWVLHILTSEEWRGVRRSTDDGHAAQQQQHQEYRAETQLLDQMLGLVFTSPSLWTLKLAATLLEESSDEVVPSRNAWLAVLEAAKADEADEQHIVLELDPITAPTPHAMDVDALETEMHVSSSSTAAASTSSASAAVRAEKPVGPRKKVGLWRPQPIGYIPPGWERDE